MKISEYDDYRSFKGWDSDSFGEISIHDKVYFNNEFDRICTSNLGDKCLLELGFGNGSFAAWASQKGFNYVGVELIPDLIAAAKASGFKVFDGAAPFEQIISPESIDYVVAFDVFEHLSKEDIDSKLAECFKILKSGGKLVGRVPSGDSPFSLALQNGDFTHKIALSSSMIKQLAISGGFEVEVIRAPAFPLRGMGIKTLLRRSVVSIVRKLFYPFFINIFMGGGPLVLTPNLLFVLKKP